MSKLVKSIYQIDKEEIKECFSAIMKSDFQTIDENIKNIWKEVIAWYALWIITEEQRKKLNEYRTRREEKNKKERDKVYINKLQLLEQYDDRPEIYQSWLIEWRIVVSSVTMEHDGKQIVKKANWESIIVYKDKTPRAYEYAIKKYQVFQGF